MHLITILFIWFWTTIFNVCEQDTKSTQTSLIQKVESGLVTLPNQARTIGE